jgi:release factor glutamine methyltransferase
LIDQREPLTIKKELEWAVPFLSASNNNIANARLEAEVLMAKVLNWERIKVLAHLLDPISELDSQGFRRLVQKRAKGYPLQYLTGSQEFMSLAFKVSPAVLIPRDDTQILVETVLSLKPQVKPNPSIIDVGTGSGIISVALKKYWPEAKVSAVDISPQALEVAKANAENHQLEIAFYQGDLLTPFQGSHTFDIIVSNPPYIPSRDIKNLQVEVTQEPVLALDGGADGLEFYRRLAKVAPSCLNPRGWLAVEIGFDQGEAVKRIFADNGFESVKVVQDYAGLDRVVYGVKS